MSGLWDSASGALIGFAAVLAAAAAVWKFKPTRWLLERLVSAIIQPARDAAEQMMRDVIREETDDLRGQIFDNGNGSLADRLGRIEQGIEETRERGLSHGDRLDRLESDDPQ